jgi:hypothetical protein
MTVAPDRSIVIGLCWVNLYPMLGYKKPKAEEAPGTIAIPGEPNNTSSLKTSTAPFPRVKPFLYATGYFTVGRLYGTKPDFVDSGAVFLAPK